MSSSEITNLCNLYQLPNLLNTSESLISNKITLDYYQSTIFNTHNSIIENDNDDEDDLLDEEDEDESNKISRRSNGIIDDLSINTGNLDNKSNDFQVLNSDNSLNQNKFNSLIGNSIKNNGGFLSNQLNKLPSYSSSLKHHHHNLINNNSSINNVNGNSLSKVTDNSISTLPPGSISLPLSVQLIRLPLNNGNSRDNSYHFNGLPYYNLNNIERELSINNLSDINYIETVHGDVILNKYINNKRVLRNFQWNQYWNSKRCVGLFKNCKRKFKKVRTINGYQRDLLLRKEKMIEFNRERESINIKIQNVNSEINNLKMKIENFKSMKLIENPTMDKTELETLVNENYSAKINELNEMNSQLRKLESNLPNFEDEIKINEKECEPDQNSLDFSNIINYRFENTNNNLIKNQLECIIEREYQINDPLLYKYQVQLFGQQKAIQFAHDINNNSFGKIYSNIVKFKRVPNPNSLGFSNIRSRKPSFL